MPSARLLLGLAALYLLTACGQGPIGPRPGVAAKARRGAPAARQVSTPVLGSTNGPDLDQDGFIDRSEAMLRKYFFDREDYSIRARRTFVLGLVAQADPDGDGRIPVAEFRTGPVFRPLEWFAISPVEIDIKLRDFALTDLDESGALDRDELMATNQPPAMAWLEGADRAALAHEVITGFDFDGDGALSRKEFVGTYCESFVDEGLGDW